MGAILKSERMTGPATPAFESFRLTDYEAEATRLVETARRQAEQLVAEAERKAPRIREEARALGHKEGYAKGLEEGRQAGREQAFAEASAAFAAQQATLVEALNRALAEFDEKKRRFLLAARTDAVELALAIGRRVVKRLADVPGETGAIAAENAAEALSLITPQSDAVLRVNPADLATMEAFAQGLAEAVRERRHVRLMADASVPPGGCIVTTAEGRVDATLETQLDRIAELLVGPRTESARRDE